MINETQQEPSNCGELTVLKHGLFTYVLLDAMSGKADGSPKDGKVTIYELKSYLNDQILEFKDVLAKRRGMPRLYN